MTYKDRVITKEELAIVHEWRDAARILLEARVEARYVDNGRRGPRGHAPSKVAISQQITGLANSQSDDVLNSLWAPGTVHKVTDYVTEVEEKSTNLNTIAIAQALKASYLKAYKNGNRFKNLEENSVAKISIPFGGGHVPYKGEFKPHIFNDHSLKAI